MWCSGDAQAMFWRWSGDAGTMLGPCSSDALIGTIWTIWSLLRAMSVLFESLGRLRSREYLEPCLFNLPTYSVGLDFVNQNLPLKLHIRQNVFLHMIPFCMNIVCTVFLDSSSKFQIGTYIKVKVKNHRLGFLSSKERQSYIEFSNQSTYSYFSKIVAFLQTPRNSTNARPLNTYYQIN